MKNPGVGVAEVVAIVKQTEQQAESAAAVVNGEKAHRAWDASTRDFNSVVQRSSACRNTTCTQSEVGLKDAMNTGDEADAILSKFDMKHRSGTTLRLRGGSAATEEATSYPSFITEKNDFNHVIRIFNTNLHGRRTVLYSLTGIKGVGRRFGDAVIKRAGIDGTKRMGELTAEEVEKLVQVRVRKKQTQWRCAPLPPASLQRGSGGKRERKGGSCLDTWGGEERERED